MMWAQVMIRHQYPFECAWLRSGGKFFYGSDLGLPLGVHFNLAEGL